MKQFDFATYAGPEVIALSGRPKGVEIRQKLDLNTLDKQQAEQITVKIPLNVVSLNSSFFLGLFADSVQALGEDGFRKKYVFEARPEIFKDINQGIEQALNKANPLKHKK